MASGSAWTPCATKSASSPFGRAAIPPGKPGNERASVRQARRLDMKSMRVLLTGHDGYIGHVLLPMLLDRGHHVTGLDSFLYEDCGFAADEVSPSAVVRRDIREVELEDLRDIDAVLHLAGISNDPLGDLEPAATYAINHEASVRLARLAKEAGVSRYVFSSSCSNYGAAGDAFLDETAGFNPVTPYAESKVWVERDVAKLADDTFSPT